MNQDIKILLLQKNVRQWTVARELKIAEATFSRLMRETLSEYRRAQIIEAIEKLSKEAANHG